MQAQFYFAFVDPGTAFNAVTHAREDAVLLSAEFGQDEGDFASLRITTINPIGGGGNALGLLGPGRKRWAWFSWDIGDGVEPLFFGRLVGIPTDVFASTITLEFQARPEDFNEQKADLAATLKVLPYWDEVFIDEQRRNDPDAVLEAYSALWHIDPVTHAVTISDYLLGEGGTEIFTASQMVATGLELAIGSPPLIGVTVDAVVQWTQRAKGTLDLTNYLNTNWPGGITSYSLTKDAWPKTGASLGEGWLVNTSSCTELLDTTVRSVTRQNEIITKWLDGESTNLQTSYTDDVTEAVGYNLTDIITATSTKQKYTEDEGKLTLTSRSSSASWSNGVVPLHTLNQTLVASYDAARKLRERIQFTLSADVQETITLIEDGPTERIDNLTSVDLSEGATPPIGDPRRRSYVALARGQNSLRYLILLARSKLRLRARTAQITFVPFLSRLTDIRLNKNAQVFDPRLPGGSVTGKIIGFKCSIVGPTEDGEPIVNLSVTIGCAVGNGGTIAAAAGDPIYVEEDYIAQAQDYQEYEGRILTFDDEVGFTQPLFNPSDDGIDFIAGLTTQSAIGTGLSVINPASTQLAAIEAEAVTWEAAPPLILPLSFPLGLVDVPNRQAMVDDRTTAINSVLEAYATKATFKLKSMNAEFETPISLIVTELKIPSMIDLAAT